MSRITGLSSGFQSGLLRLQNLRLRLGHSVSIRIGLHFGFACVLVLLTNLGLAQNAIQSETATLSTIDGLSINTKAVSEQGQFMLLFAFAHWCESCEEYLEAYEGLYQDYGCNTGQLYTIGLEADGNDGELAAFALPTQHNQSANYESIYKTEFANAPLASGIDGNAASLVESLNIEAYPSFVLVDPSGNIVEPDIWPSSSQQISEVLASYGIQKNACKTTRQSEFELQKDKITLLPNPVQDQAILQLDLLQIREFQVTVYSTLGTKLLEIKTSTLEAGAHTIKLNTAALSIGNYLVELIDLVDKTSVRKVITMEKVQ